MWRRPPVDSEDAASPEDVVGRSAVSQNAAILVLADDDTEALLTKIADELVADSRFIRSDDIVPFSGSTRLTCRADRMLVARLAEITGMFPVESQLLERARSAAVKAAALRYDDTSA